MGWARGLQALHRRAVLREAREEVLNMLLDLLLPPDVLERRLRAVFEEDLGARLDRARRLQQRAHRRELAQRLWG